MNVPPPLSESPYPRFDLPEAQGPRNYGGWIVLALFFTLMIGLQLADYLDRGDRPRSKFGNTALELKLAVELREAAHRLSPTSLSTANQSLNRVIKQVERDAPTDLTAARIYAAAKSELKGEIPASILDRLRTSDDPRDKVLAEAFSSKSLTLARAKEIDRKLEGKGIVDKLAEVHAYEKAGDPSHRKRAFPDARIYGLLGGMSLAVAAGGLGFLVLLGFVIAKLAGRLPAKGFPLEKLSLPDADRLALRCAQLYAVFLGAQIVAPMILSGFGANVVDKHTATLLTYLALISVSLYLFKFPIGARRFSLADIGITKDNLGANITWGVGCALANLPLVLCAALLGQALFSGLPPPEHPATVQIQDGVNWFGMAVIFFAGSVGAPILEEIMFRGTLLPALARVWGRPALAIIIQGLIFAAIHPTGVPAWLPLATIGAMSGFLSRQTGSLVPSIVMHAVHNFGTLVLATTLLR